MTLEQEKSAARKAAKAKRKNLAEENPNAANTAMQHLLNYLAGNRPKCLAGYLPIGSELDPQPTLSALRKEGVTTALPVVVAPDNPLIFRNYQPDDSLITEMFGTRAPATSAPVAIPEIVLVPLLAFDRKGYRLGYGGGFYDRTIALFQEKNRKCAFIGFAYAAQQVKEVPIGEFDLPLQAIMTEKGIIE